MLFDSNIVIYAQKPEHDEAKDFAWIASLKLANPFDRGG